MTSPDPGDPVPAEAELAEILACGRRIMGLLHGRGEARDVDAALAEVRRLPADLPQRSGLAMGLILVILRTGREHGPWYLHHVAELIEIVDRHPPPGPEWARLRPAARVFGNFTDLGQVDARRVLGDLDDLGAALGDDATAQPAYQMMRLGMSFLAAFEDGDEAKLRRTRDEIEQLRGRADDSELGQLMETLLDGADLLRTSRYGQPAETVRAFDQFRESVGSRQVAPFLHRAVAETETVFLPLRHIFSQWDSSSPARPTDEQIAAIRALAEQDGVSDAERATYRAALGAAELAGGRETDLGRIDAAIESFRQALTESPTDDPRRVFHLQSLGLALFRRSEVTGRVDGLAEAAQLLAEARDLAGGAAHPLWSLASGTYSQVMRRLGETRDSRRAALEGLRSYAWNALLQSEPAAAALVARDAAGEALELARWCLSDHEPVDAIRALDASRGLVLFAATELRNVTARLDAAGRRDLSHRWRLATGAGGSDEVPADLRREVLTALARTSGAAVDEPGGLLDPPGLPEIQSALLTLDADAVVYLVPGTGGLPGWAIIAPAEGPPSYMALPNLVMDAEVDVERHLTALSTRDAVLADSRELVVESAQTHALGSLDVLCDWAWRAAIGPLLDRQASWRPRAPSDRPPRIVLIPIGDLARVPWQAARNGNGSYAVELAAFSQAASARMLCNSAALTPVPLAPVGLVVGDPDTAGEASELTAARVEAYAIRQAYYRGARYVGRRPDRSPSPSGAGTSKDVRDWLTGGQPGGGAMLHLSCHGVVQPDPEAGSSYLLLANRDRLAAEELIGLLAAAPERAIGLVVLAACRTGVSSRGYDEAYSLGTAFLAGGVRSVLSTQWSIPDRTTSLMMFMFHHFLMTERRPAWDALRLAQLWMLDPDRRPPERMPPTLRRQLVETDPARVVAWAGFVHWGQ